MAKMKTNQDGGGKSSTAAAGELKNNQKIEGGARKGAAKAKPDANGDGIPDYAQDGIGASRMGYNQSFGAARVSGYSKGAAKVADIMSFGASKYMNHGAADAGHGGPAGHEHASKTILKRETSGGGSSSSSSSTSGGSGTGISYASAYNNADKNKYPTLGSFTDAAKAYNASNSSSSSTSSGGGSSTTSSKTIVSPNSMAETQLQGEIKSENRQSLNNFKRAETNIKAATDSINVSNRFLDKLPTKTSRNPKAKLIAGKKGGRAAMTTRARSGNFSSQEALAIYKAGQK